MNPTVFFLIICLCISIVKSQSSGLDVPFVPTPYEVVNGMLDISQTGPQDTLYDLGCGDGRIVITAASKRGVKKAVGIDLDPQRIKECRENAKNAGVNKQVSFIQGDLFSIDFHQATVLTLYLLPDVNLKLRPKIFATLRPGTRVVSHDFDMGSWKADKEQLAGSSYIYLWVVPANISGLWSWNLPDDPQNKVTTQINQQFQNITAKAYHNNNELKVSGILINGSFFSISINTQKSTDDSLPTTFIGTVEDNQINGTSQSRYSESLPWTAARDPSTIQNIAPEENVFPK